MAARIPTLLPTTSRPTASTLGWSLSRTDRHPLKVSMRPLDPSAQTGLSNLWRSTSSTPAGRLICPYRPFTRNSPHVVNEYDQNGKMSPVIVVSAEDLKAIALIETIDTIEAYEAASDAVEKVVRARTMGTTGDPSLRDSILAMKKR
eukprot:PhF_6_TR33746/c0_g2_i1/m.49541